MPTPEQTSKSAADVMTREEFVNYLRGTLCPALRDSGMYATAIDFENAALLIEDPKLKSVVMPCGQADY